MLYLFANWKSHKNILEAREWMYALKDVVSNKVHELLNEKKMAIVIFPPAPLIYPVHTMCIDIEGFSVGIQDISHLPEGKHTGLIAARSVQTIATYALLGHAEVRKRGDDREKVLTKHEHACNAGLVPLLCMSNPKEYIPETQMVAFEPLEAIGSGANATPEQVKEFRSKLPEDIMTFIYGGSVTAQNCDAYLKPRICDGFLVGQTSLDARAFGALMHACASYI